MHEARATSIRPPGLAGRPILDRRPVRIIVSICLLGGAIAYLWHVVTAEGESLESVVWLLDPATAALSIALFVPMYFAQAGYHAAVLGAMGDKPAQFASADQASYLQSQIVRYLPGKIWGLVYQVQSSAARHPPGRILAANLWQTAITNALSFGIAIALVLWGLGYIPAFAAGTLVALCVALVHLAHHSRAPSAVHRWILTRLPKREFLSHARPPLTPPSRGTSLLLVEWVFFAAGFIVLIGDSHSLADSVAMIGWYAASSTLSIFALAVPAGLAVREAIFVTAQEAISATGTSLLAIAAQARVCMLIAELVACFLATARSRVKLHG